MARSLRVLLVEDEPVDVMTLRRAIRRRALEVELVVTESAEQAIDRLREHGTADAATELPDLVLADLRLPRLSGLDLLERVKSDPVLRGVPFVLLSTSTHPSDAAQAYSLGAAGYFTKPVDFEDYEQTVDDIFRFYARAQPRTAANALAAPGPGASEAHYLEEELLNLLHEDPRIFDYLQDGVTDGLWYWDLENPEHEWMSPGFWSLFGYDAASKPHLASAWQELIDPAHRDQALANLEKHCADPRHPYDQVVRYRHRDGSFVWVRCRGIAIRDTDGRPLRMLGAHTDVTADRRARSELRAATRQLERIHEILESVEATAATDALVHRVAAALERAPGQR